MHRYYRRALARTRTCTSLSKSEFYSLGAGQVCKKEILERTRTCASESAQQRSFRAERFDYITRTRAIRIVKEAACVGVAFFGEQRDAFPSTVHA
jgi:hypothetical protein